jgi:hypothetical protein
MERSLELSVTDERNLQVLAAELQILEKCLRFAVGGFRASIGSERRPPVRIALNALSNFVGNVFSLDQDLRQPLNELLYGLHDLDHGQIVPLLAQAKVNHRPKGALSINLFRAVAAALMDLYLQAGMSRKGAAGHAAIKLNELGYRDENDQRIDAKNVARWRDELKSPLDKGAAAVPRYHFILEWLRFSHPNEPDKAAEFLLGALPDMIAPSIPKNLSS